MRLSRLSLIVAATVLLLAGAPGVRAQETLETESGRTYTGKILSNDGTTVEIQTEDGATLKLPCAQLTPKTQYRLRLAITPDDGKSRLELAEWCVDQTLYQEAKAQFRKALAADASMEEEINARLVEARTEAANEIVARAKKLQASNQKQEARRILSLLVQELPLEEASKEAEQMLAAETEQRKQDSLSRRSAGSAGSSSKTEAPPPNRESGEPFSADTVKLFQPIIDSYRKMLDATQAGLTKGESAGIKEFEKALKEGESIRKAAEKLRPQAGGNNDEITEAMALVDSKLEEAVVDVRINLVDSYLLRSSYKQAADVVRAGLAEYPKNERLRSAMAQVTAATASNDGGGWGFVGGRGR